MADFYIKKLTITGSGKEPSVVDFTEGLNIITGPSDTGKSYIAECIDYMFGADKTNFDGNTGYDTFNLVVSTIKGDVSFTRKLGKKSFSVSSGRGDIESGDYVTKWSEKSKNPDISDVWLRIMGIEATHKIIKNVRRESQRLTLRTFAHMLLIKEDYVIQRLPIILPIQNTNQTAALSALFFLISGEDFADSTPKEEKKIREARKKAVISYINSQLAEFAKKKTALQKLPSADVSELQAQVDHMIDEIGETERQIAIAAGRSKALLAEIYMLCRELSECNTTYDRFQDLRSQYAADIERLGFIVDGEAHHHELAANKNCPYCDGKISPRKQESYLEASRAELVKIQGLLDDLLLAEADLIANRTELDNRIAALNGEKSSVEALINTQLKPRADMLKRSVDEFRYAIELRKESSVIGDFETALKADLLQTMTEEEVTDQDFKIKSYFDAAVFKALNGYLNNILEACNYLNLSNAYISPSDFDAVINGQAKAQRGKGYRAFLNTVVALALAEYLAAEGHCSPSMLIVDSPILSLREGIDDKAPDSMKAGLFKYLLSNQGFGQVIIIENEIPPNLDYTNAHVIEFTKGRKPGRYGLLHGVQS